METDNTMETNIDLNNIFKDFRVCLMKLSQASRWIIYTTPKFDSSKNSSETPAPINLRPFFDLLSQIIDDYNFAKTDRRRCEIILNFCRYGNGLPAISAYNTAEYEPKFAKVREFLTWLTEFMAEKNKGHEISLYIERKINIQLKYFTALGSDTFVLEDFENDFKSETIEDRFIRLKMANKNLISTDKDMQYVQEISNMFFSISTFKLLETKLQDLRNKIVSSIHDIPIDDSCVYKTDEQIQELLSDPQPFENVPDSEPEPIPEAVPKPGRQIIPIPGPDAGSGSSQQSSNSQSSSETSGDYALNPIPDDEQKSNWSLFKYLNPVTYIKIVYNFVKSIFS